MFGFLDKLDEGKKSPLMACCPVKQIRMAFKLNKAGGVGAHPPLQTECS